MSAIGTKRTCVFAPHMSAFDPKRTWPQTPYCCLATCYPTPQMASSSFGVLRAPTRFHKSYSGLGNHVAARGARAAARTDATRRRANPVCERQSGRTGTYRGIHQRIAAVGLDRWPRSAIGYRWDTGDLRKVATELIAMSPDVILAIATPAAAALQQATRTVPIVFTQVADPVSAGFVASLAKPGGNMTGFTKF